MINNIETIMLSTEILEQLKPIIINQYGIDMIVGYNLEYVDANCVNLTPEGKYRIIENKLGLNKLLIKWENHYYVANGMDLEIYNIIVMFPDFAKIYNVDPQTPYGTFRYYFSKYLQENLPPQEIRIELIKFNGRDYWNNLYKSS